MAGLRQHVVERTMTENAQVHTTCAGTRFAPWPQDVASRKCESPDQLFGTIAREVVPRLVLAHRSLTASVCDQGPDAPVRSPTRSDITEFGQLLIETDHAAISRYIEAYRGRGLSVETMYLDLLAPTARHLGELWDEDLCHFTDVTLGLHTLQRILRDLRPEFLSVCSLPRLGRQVLLAPGARDQHTFGLFMVAEFLSRAGWIVTLTSRGSAREIAGLVRKRWFSLIGFSLSCDSGLDELAATIRTVRRTSRNRSVGVLVGGRVFADRPDLVRLVGADATAADARNVAPQAKNVLNLLPDYQ